MSLPLPICHSKKEKKEIKLTVKHRKLFQSFSTQSTFLSTGVSGFDRISLELNQIQPGQQKGNSAGRQDSGLLSNIRIYRLVRAHSKG